MAFRALHMRGVTAGLGEKERFRPGHGSAGQRTCRQHRGSRQTGEGRQVLPITAQLQLAQSWLSVGVPGPASSGSAHAEYL